MSHYLTGEDWAYLCGVLIVLLAVAGAACFALGKSRGRAEVIGWIKEEERKDWERKVRNLVRAQEGRIPEPKGAYTSMNPDRDLVRNASDEVISKALYNLRDD